MWRKVFLVPASVQQRCLRLENQYFAGYAARLIDAGCCASLCAGNNGRNLNCCEITAHEKNGYQYRRAAADTFLTVVELRRNLMRAVANITTSGGWN